MNPRPHHHISKVPDGYLIRTKRNGVLHQRFVRRGLGIAAALAARDELLAGLPAPDYEANRVIAHTVARSNTGLVGLSFTLETHRDRQYEVIKASVRSERCRPHGKTFFISPTGRYNTYEEALEAAFEWREDILERRRRRRRQSPKKQ